MMKKEEFRMKYSIDDFILFRGVIFVRGWILSPDYTIELIVDEKFFAVKHKKIISPDIMEAFGNEYSNNRFEFNVDIEKHYLKNAKINFIFEESNLIVDPILDLTKNDIFFNSKNIFDNSIDYIIKGKILEIGSRARSGINRKEIFNDFEQYIGFDIVEGENVDIIGDAHLLSKKFESSSIDCIFSVSVFEHLINPLKVVYEMNKILKIGGFCQVNTHQQWPVHNSPWDFNRFSKYAWYGLFNETTGFEVIESVQGEPAYTAPVVTHANHKGLDYELGYLSSKVVVRKISDKYIDIPYDQSYMTDVYPH